LSGQKWTSENNIDSLQIDLGPGLEAFICNQQNMQSEKNQAEAQYSKSLAGQVGARDHKCFYG
jgi:hypothetical protein